MKTKFSKRILSLFLAVMMVVTALPFASFSANAEDAKDRYLFAYFVGNAPAEQRIRFAVSKDGLNFEALNGNNAVITQTVGTQCCRDPYIFQGNDGAYYIICTDMNSAFGWTGTGVKIVIWKSTDLINWTNETLIDMPTLVGEDLKYCWAPQAIWDRNHLNDDGTYGAYMVYFTLGATNYTSDKQVLYYCYTTDLLDQSKWSQPELLFAPSSGNPAIDGDIMYNSNTGYYYLYFKDESTKKINYVKSTSITGPWSDPVIVIDTTVDLEGANCYVNNETGKVVMIVDAFNDGYFVVAESSDYENFTVLDQSQYAINQLSPRHGSIINITTAQYEALIDNFGLTGDISDYYKWSTSYEVNDDGWVYFPSDGHPQYQEAETGNYANGAKEWWGNVVIGNGTCMLRNANLFLESTRAKSILRGDKFSITFDYTYQPQDRDGTTLDKSSNVMISVSSNIDNTTFADHILVRNDGTLSANGIVATGKANVVAGVKNSYMINYDGTQVSLFQNNVCVATVDTTLSVPDIGALFVGLGFTDSVGAANGRGYGIYGPVKISSTVNVMGNLTENSANNAQAETFNNPAYFGDHIATNAYTNTIYSSKTRSESGEAKTGYVKFKFVFPKVSVMAYDGVNVYSPAVVTISKNGALTKKVRRVIHNDSQPAIIKEKWQGYTSYTSDAGYPWPGSSTIIDTFEFNNNQDDLSDSVDNKDTPRAYYNRLYYTGDFSSNSNYYDTVSNLRFEVRSNSGSNTYENLNASFTNYYLNYEPIKKIIKKDSSENVTVNETGNSYNFTDLYDLVYKNQWKYTDESLGKYFTAVSKIVNLNLNGEFSDANDSNVESKVINTAAKIKDAYNSYKSAAAGLTLKQFDITYTQINGTKIVKTVSAGNTLSGTIPDNSSATYNNNKTHNTYIWSAGCEAKHMPKGDESYYEYAVVNDCSFNSTTDIQPTCEKEGLATYTCSVCQGSYEGPLPKLGHAWSSEYTSNNDGRHNQICTRDPSHILESPCELVETDNGDGTAKVECEKCGYSKTVIKLNRDAYNNAVNAAKAVILNETAKYSADSLNALQAVLNEAATDSLNAQNQKELDLITAKIIAANSTDTAKGGVLVANTFRITYGNMFNYNEFMNSDSRNISKTEWGRIDFDIANQVFTVIGNGAFTTDKDGNTVPANDVYSAYGSGGTYKIPVTEGTSYTFEYTAKGTILNQAFIFFYNSTNTPIHIDTTFNYTYNGTEMTAAENDYFVCKYRAEEGIRNVITFTAPANCTHVDFRFGLIKSDERCDFYNIGFYETSKADKFLVAENVVYDTDISTINLGTPIDEGKHFEGWFTDAELTSPVETLGKVKSNINLYPKLGNYVVASTGAATILNGSYTEYICECGEESTRYRDYANDQLDGTEFFAANNSIQSIIDTERANGYQNYTKASIDTIASERESIYNTAITYNYDTDVHNATVRMNALLNSLVVKINFVVKEDGGVDKTITQEIPYKGALEAQPVDTYTTVEGRYTWSFTSWDKKIVTSNITTGATYIAQYSKVDHLDRSAFDAAYAEAQAELENTAKWTPDSRAALQSVFDKSIIRDDTTMTEVDQLIRNLKNAIGSLELQDYTVRLFYVVDGAKTLDTVQSKSNQPYGTTFSFTVPEDYKNNYAVEKWTRMFSDDKTEKVGSTNTSIGIGVTGNADYYLYLKKVSASDKADEATIYLKNAFGKTVDVAYVTAGSEYTVSVSGNTLTINDQTLTAPALTFYSFSNFAIGGEPVTDGQAITVTEDIEITALYSAINTYTITCDSTCTPDKETAYWDEKVTVTAVDGTDNTKWFIDGKLVGYGKTYTFRACKHVSISCETPADAVAVPTATVTNLTYGGYEAKTITAIGSFSLPEGYTLVNTGVLLKTTSVNNPAAVNNIDNYTGANANAKKFIAENYVKDTKQFIINVHSAKEYPSLYVGAVAYVTYKDAKGNEGTAYSSLVTFQYGA